MEYIGNRASCRPIVINKLHSEGKIGEEERERGDGENGTERKKRTLEQGSQRSVGDLQL